MVDDAAALQGRQREVAQVEMEERNEERRERDTTSAMEGRGTLEQEGRGEGLATKREAPGRGRARELPFGTPTQAVRHTLLSPLSSDKNKCGSFE